MDKRFKTKYSVFITKISNSITLSLVGPWKTRSIGLISILVGFYVSTNLISLLIDKNISKIFILIILLLILECFVRIRTILLRSNRFSLYLSGLDNIRIGATYAIVLEAFKLGS